jgi:hypothetical protein
MPTSADAPRLVAVHQPHYLPWLRYVEKIARADVFIVLDTISYSKNGWQNRNRIKTDGGSALLTVPVEVSLGDTLDQARICNRTPWQRKHWQTISQHYRNAPYFDRYAPLLEPVYGRTWERLADLNRHMLGLFLGALGITTTVQYASEMDAPGTATERLVNLVRAVGGTSYYSGAYALDAYLDPALFREAGIGLLLQHWTAPVYPQLHGAFVPDLSVLDLLMNVGPGSRDVLLASATPVRGDTP